MQIHTPSPVPHGFEIAGRAVLSLIDQKPTDQLVKATGRVRVRVRVAIVPHPVEPFIPMLVEELLERTQGLHVWEPSAEGCDAGHHKLLIPAIDGQHRIKTDQDGVLIAKFRRQRCQVEVQVFDKAEEGWRFGLGEQGSCLSFR